MTKVMNQSALELEKRRQQILAGRDPTTPCFTVCAGTGCCAGAVSK